MLYCNNDAYMTGLLDECAFESAKAFLAFWKAKTGKTIDLYKRAYRYQDHGLDYEVVEFVDSDGDIVLESGDDHVDADFDFPSADELDFSTPESRRDARMESEAESRAWERSQYRF